jgi:hypothetical protein
MTKAVEVITSVQRRRRWSRAEKERIVAAALEPGASASEVARAAGSALRSPMSSSARATTSPRRIAQRSRILCAGFPAGSTMWPLAVFETRWSTATSTRAIFAAMSGL